MYFAENPYPGVPQRSAPRIGRGPQNHLAVSRCALPVMHYKLPVLGFRIGPIAYITDANAFSPETWERLEGVRFWCSMP